MSGILANTYFWQALATAILFYVLYSKGVFGMLGAALDKRADRISAELAEARKLRADAEALLLEYERKRGRAESEAAEIVAAAREEAERISKDAETRLKEYIARRTAAAEAKIAQAEEQALAEVRNAAVAAAVSAAETVLRGSVQGKIGEDLVRQGLTDVRGRLS